MSNKIQLPDGKFLIKDYGKYNSGLIFISATGKIPQQEYHPKDFNLIGTHTIYGTKGYFYISKAGNPCFRIDENGEHILLEEQWGGSFGTYDIAIENLPNKLYEINKRSNGGGLGYYYCVVPVGTKYVPPAEEYQEEV